MNLVERKKEKKATRNLIYLNCVIFESFARQKIGIESSVFQQNNNITEKEIGPKNWELINNYYNHREDIVNLNQILAG